MGISYVNSELTFAVFLNASKSPPTHLFYSGENDYGFKKAGISVH